MPCWELEHMSESSTRAYFGKYPRFKGIGSKGNEQKIPVGNQGCQTHLVFV